MLNGVKTDLVDYLKRSFESGYANAASSLSRMTGSAIQYKDFHVGFHQPGALESADVKSISRGGKRMLLTTEVFGEVTGKSYLCLSEVEFEKLTAHIPVGKVPGVNFKEEFAKELDNILSASVITRLSNDLRVKVYGDIPILVGQTTATIEDIIREDFADHTSKVYINSIYFSFAKEDSLLSPHFVWVMNGEVLSAMESKAIG